MAATDLRDELERIATQTEGFTLSTDGRATLQKAAELLSWLDRQADFRSAMAVPEREPFPVATYEDCCPACGADSRSLQLSEETTRYWRGFAVENGGLFVYDDTTYDEGDDEHISCIVCQAEWAVPEEVVYG